MTEDPTLGYTVDLEFNQAHIELAYEPESIVKMLNIIVQQITSADGITQDVKDYICTALTATANADYKKRPAVIAHHLGLSAPRRRRKDDPDEVGGVAEKYMNKGYSDNEAFRRTAKQLGISSSTARNYYNKYLENNRQFEEIQLNLEKSRNAD